MVPATSPAASRASTNNKKKRSRNEISTSEKVENGGSKSKGPKRQRSSESSAKSESLNVSMTTSIANSPSTDQQLANSNNPTIFSGSSIPNPPPRPPQQKRPSVQTALSGQKLLVPPPPFGGSSDDSEVVGTDERATAAVPMNSNVWRNNHRNDSQNSKGEMATDIAARSLNTDNDDDCRQGSKKAARTNNNCLKSSSQAERCAQKMGSNSNKKFSPIFLILCLSMIGLVVVTSLWLHQSLTIQMDLAELRQHIDYHQVRLDAYKQAVDGTGNVIDVELDEADQMKSIEDLKARLQQQEFWMEGIKTNG